MKLMPKNKAAAPLNDTIKPLINIVIIRSRVLFCFQVPNKNSMLKRTVLLSLVFVIFKLICVIPEKHLKLLLSNSLTPNGLYDIELQLSGQSQSDVSHWVVSRQELKCPKNVTSQSLFDMKEWWSNMQAIDGTNRFRTRRVEVWHTAACQMSPFAVTWYSAEIWRVMSRMRWVGLVDEAASTMLRIQSFYAFVGDDFVQLKTHCSDALQDLYNRILNLLGLLSWSDYTTICWKKTLENALHRRHQLYHECTRYWRKMIASLKFNCFNVQFDTHNFHVTRIYQMGYNKKFTGSNRTTKIHFSYQ